MSRRVAVTIDQVVLHGFDPRDRRRIGESFEAELGRLCALGLPPAVEARRGGRVDAGDVPIGGLRSPDAGAGFARAVHAKLEA
jgi:hypothetical protein